MVSLLNVGQRKERDSLALRARAGNNYAATHILEAFSGTIKSIARRYASGRHTQEELEAEATHALYIALQRHDPEKGFSAIYAIQRATGAIIDYISRESRLRQRERLFGDGDIEAQERPHEHDDFDRVDARDEVEYLLTNSKLTPRQREVINFIYGLCKTYREAGEQLGISTGTVSNLHHKALEKLREAHRAEAA